MSFDTSGRGISQLPQRTLFVPQHLALLGVKGNCAKDPEPFLQAVSINLQVPLASACKTCSIRLDRANFRRLVLGCIEASKQCSFGLLRKKKPNFATNYSLEKS